MGPHRGWWVQCGWGRRWRSFWGSSYFQVEKGFLEARHVGQLSKIHAFGSLAIMIQERLAAIDRLEMPRVKRGYE